MLQNFIPNRIKALIWLAFGLTALCNNSQLQAQNHGSERFYWDPQSISDARLDLFTRAQGSTTLTIPIPGEPIVYHIRTHPFITVNSANPEESKSYQPFSGTDSLGNTLYGYYYKDRFSLSYYHQGRLYSISPADEPGIYVRSGIGEDLVGELECATIDVPRRSVRAGGNSIPCQTQNYNTWTFDLYLACTGEWGTYYNENKTSAILALLDQGNMLNSFYRGEMGIQFNLITSDNTTYTDPDTDPFDPGSTTTNRAEQARKFFVDSLSGETYDVGHVMHRRAGSGISASGVAYLKAICDKDYKGGGWTGTTVPDNESFTFQVFGHEIGHQLGANHSFYGSAGACSGSNRSAGNGFEPGSGSSFMSYQGQCGSHNLDGPASQTTYFNTHSINEILQFIPSGCGTKSGSGSRISVQMPSDFSVPLHTAFDLTASGEGTFNYNWEQYDTDNSTTHTDPIEAGMYAGTPMYRSYDPSSTGYQRSFPSKNAQRNGISRGEVYASVPRDITLRLTTRAGGTVQCDEMTVTVRDAPPLKILEPLGGDLVELSNPSVRSSHLMTVRWETGDTENHGFPTVDILFSTDGGVTFPYVLAEGVTNDGEHEVQPTAETDQARLKIVLSDGTDRMAIYHESPENFTVAFSILPIQIAAFTGREMENYHQLSWTLHNTGEIVRSVQLQYGFDGIRFRGIPLPGYGVLNEEATWSDNYNSRFIQGAQTYYRLAVIDMTGHTTYSPVIRLNQTTGHKEFWSLFPNPAQGVVRLEFDTYLNPEAKITLWSINGQKILDKTVGNQAKSLTIPLDCPEGLYIVEVNNGGDLHRKKLIIATTK